MAAGPAHAGPVRVRLITETSIDEVTSHNVVGELAGADDDWVVVGSHHDGPWSSAVEDGSGTALVLAQAAHWASVPDQDRPHRLVFVLHAAHLAGWAGQLEFIDRHRSDLDRTVLEVHLEHAAREFEDVDGVPTPTGLVVPRWFFTSTVPALEAAVREALVAEGVSRSLILPPTALGDPPPTDAAYYYAAGVPIVNLLSAPYYLVDSSDTIDKVDRDGLLPLSLAMVRVIEATRGVAPGEWRVRA